MVLIIAAYRRIHGWDDPASQDRWRKKMMRDDWERLHREQIHEEQERLSKS
jgi:hypothetical protein